VLRTSGSAPRFPIRMALLRLRLTCTSSVRQEIPMREHRLII
jgi:hypothetical protein